MRSDARKRLHPEPLTHHDPAVRVLITQARAQGARDALLEAAGRADWMTYPAAKDPREWARWLRYRADEIEVPS